MPFYVITGVRSGRNRYVAGDRLPDGIGDEAMVEAGAIEWRDDAPPAQSADGLAEFLGVQADGAAPLLNLSDKESANLDALSDALEKEGLELTAEAAPAPSEPDIDAMDFNALRKAAKAAGINSFGKSADALRDELREVS